MVDPYNITWISLHERKLDAGIDPNFSLTGWVLKETKQVKQNE